MPMCTQKGADKTGTYIPLTSGTSSANETYYTVPCYSPRYDYNGETSGFPVDTVIFRITSNVLPLSFESCRHPKDIRG